MQRTLSLTYLIILGAIWGAGYTVAKLAMVAGATPLGYAFWQSLGPGIITLLITFLLRQPFPLSRRFLSFYAVCGGVGIAIPNATLYFIAPHLPAGLLAVVVNIVPIVTYPLAILCRQERFNWRRLSGVCFGLFGIGLILIPQAQLPDISRLHWVLLALLAPICFAICAIFISAKWPKDGSPLTLASGMLLTSVFFLLSIVYGTHQFYPVHLHDAASRWILLEILLSSIGYVLLFKLLKRAGPVYYSMIGTIVLLSGLFWGKFVFHEALPTWLVVATTSIIIGILLITYARRVRDENR